MLAREPVASSFEPGDHASTFGGSPLPAAVAVAVLDAIRDENLLARAAAIGERLAEGLKVIQEKTPLVTEVRARGLMIAVDLARPVAARAKAECLARGLLLITVGDQTLRLLPPMVLSKEQADRGLAILAEVLEALGRD
jgi:4-aminobutyrate aminotransferase-like enzyme